MDLSNSQSSLYYKHKKSTTITQTDIISTNNQLRERDRQTERDRDTETQRNTTANYADVGYIWWNAENNARQHLGRNNRKKIMAVVAKRSDYNPLLFKQ